MSKLHGSLEDVNAMKNLSGKGVVGGGLQL